ncbi:MAG: arylamine N-acetyltransferase [Tatlockia sp.]|nr:arylamine N-acetyltransferase [Tatlockia sp.]
MFSKFDKKNDLIINYFKKINCEYKKVHSYSKEQKIDYLQQIYSSHMQSYPFHNFELRATSQLHPLYRNRLTLNNMDSFIEGCNGGFCFQSSEVFYSALRNSGFDTYRSIAKILNGLAPDSPEAKKIPATHLILIVDIENDKYLIDPSMGMNGCCSPFLIPKSAEIYQQNNQSFKIEKIEDDYLFYRKTNEQWSISLCSTFSPANQTTILTQLTKLSYYPLALGIRDLITLVGIATPNGGKCLLWNPKTKLFTLKTICTQKGDKEESFDDIDTAYELLCNVFRIEHINKLQFKEYCGLTKWPKAKNLFFVNLPLDKREIESLKENLESRSGL